MPRTSMLESLLSQAATPRPESGASALPDPTPGTALAAGASHVVEAATTEAALAELRDLLGPEARIVDARRIRRGGIGGFFAKEVVQLHATTAADTPDAVDAAAGAAAAIAADRVDGPAPAMERTSMSPVDRLLADAEDAPVGMDFATYLQGHLPSDHRLDAGDPPPARLTAPPADPARSARGADVGPAARPRDDAMRVAPWLSSVAEPPAKIPDAEGVGWSRDALMRLGLPVELVRSVERASPGDDLSWTLALTEAIRPSCRPLPAGPCVLVGPHAHALGTSDDMGEVEVARSRTWFDALRRGRWVHLVVGGEGWRRVLDDEPLAVSWSREEDLPDALRCAIELGLVLGFGPGAGTPRRARPLEVALAVRDLVVGR